LSFDALDEGSGPGKPTSCAALCWLRQCRTNCFTEEDGEKYVSMLEEQNKLLREYLDSRQVASLANEAGENLSEKAHALPLAERSGAAADLVL
jgi:hypothetical protein